MLKEIVLHNKTFILFISNKQIQYVIKKMAIDVYKEYKNNIPVFIGILNGVIFFFSDFLKNYPGLCNIDFIQLYSYKGLYSTGNIKIVSDGSINLHNKDVIIFDDVIDTGNTLHKVYQILLEKKVRSIKIAALFFKDDINRKQDLKVDFIGINISSNFIVGYGLDFDNLGRNYLDIYQLKN
jgi:hypoxanthine phosphoribosyltransferase